MITNNLRPAAWLACRGLKDKTRRGRLLNRGAIMAINDKVASCCNGIDSFRFAGIGIGRLILSGICGLVVMANIACTSLEVKTSGIVHVPENSKILLVPFGLKTGFINVANNPMQDVTRFVESNFDKNIVRPISKDDGKMFYDSICCSYVGEYVGRKLIKEKGWNKFACDDSLLKESAKYREEFINDIFVSYLAGENKMKVQPGSKLNAINGKLPAELCGMFGCDYLMWGEVFGLNENAVIVRVMLFDKEGALLWCLIAKEQSPVCSVWQKTGRAVMGKEGEWQDGTAPKLVEMIIDALRKDIIPTHLTI